MEDSIWTGQPGNTETVWRRRILITLACLAGLALNAYQWLPVLPDFFARPNNDFIGIYAGAVLAGSGGLYDAEAVKRTEMPLGDKFLVFPRLPYYDALISPLRFLGFRQAYLVWQGVSLAAVLIFLFFWPGPRRWVAVCACCWSAPLFNCFIVGQDITLPLAALALSLALFFRGRHFAR